MSDIDTLRDSLFSTLAALQDKEAPMEIDRAKAICEVGQVIINSAKIEIDFLRANGSIETKFFHKPELVAVKRVDALELQESGSQRVYPISSQTQTGTKTVVGNVTSHKLK